MKVLAMCVWSFPTTTFDLYVARIRAKSPTATQWHLADYVRLCRDRGSLLMSIKRSRRGVVVRLRSLGCSQETEAARKFLRARKSDLPIRDVVDSHCDTGGTVAVVAHSCPEAWTIWFTR